MLYEVREIKFRVWDKEDKVIRGWGWILENWSILYDILTLKIYPPIFKDSVTSNQAYNKSWELTLMQYTGLKDKNGKEIYEGDIIKFTLPEWNLPTGYQNYDGDFELETVNERTIICEVRIRNTRGAGMVYRKDVNDETVINLKNHWFKIKKTDKVIGNIHENPELIKEIK